MSTHETFCSAGAGRGEQLVAYLYDDMEAADREAIEAHLSTCVVCRRELNELRAVQKDLAQWTPPVFGRSMPLLESAAPRRASVWARLTGMPVWAQTAAALLCVGVAAGLANLEVRYDSEGLAIHTGWLRADTAQTVPAPAISPVAASTTERPWQLDLTRLEEKLRAELKIDTNTSAIPAATVESAPAPVNVRALIEDSEQRQQRELALRLAEVLRDVQSQRRDDLEKIDRSLGVIQANLGVMQNTGVEVMRQRQMINDLAVRVSSQR